MTLFIAESPLAADRHVVTDISETQLRKAHSPSGARRREHLVTLGSVEDDALGAEFEVIWELEPLDPDIAIIKKVTLPTYWSRSI